MPVAGEINRGEVDERGVEGTEKERCDEQRRESSVGQGHSEKKKEAEEEEKIGRKSDLERQNI